jgi:hypothetical protein
MTSPEDYHFKSQNQRCDAKARIDQSEDPSSRLNVNMIGGTYMTTY